MSVISSNKSHLVIACGGTGGHLFPGVAVGVEWLARGGTVTLVISEKEIDQVALGDEKRFDLLKLPAVGLGQGSALKVVLSLARSYTRCRSAFAHRSPQAVLAMGGFTSMAPMLAGRRSGAALFLHDSNAIPGRANRWLSLLVDEAFVGFEEAKRRLRTTQVHRTGTPVRPAFSQPHSSVAARTQLGLDPDRPVLLIMGGSQGAHGVNESMLRALPTLRAEWPELQFVHLSGKADLQLVESRYRELGAQAVIRPFLAEIHVALAAADMVVSRAGGSSLAEFAAMQVPPLLIPLPSAADDHQTANARAFSNAGAGICLSQREALAGRLTDQVLSLRREPRRREQMSSRLSEFYVADSAKRIVDRMAAHLQFSETGRTLPASSLFCVHP